MQILEKPIDAYTAEAGTFLMAQIGTLNGFDFSFSFYALVFPAVKRKGTSSPLFYRGKSFSYRFTDGLFRTEKGFAASKPFKVSFLPAKMNWPLLCYDKSPCFLHTRSTG